MSSQPIFNDLVGIMAVILMVPVTFLWLERKTRWKIFNVLPAIIWIFLTPIFLSNFGVIPRESPVYDTFKSFAVPLFIVLMLLDINIRDAVKVAWRGAIVLVVGSVGVVVGAGVAFVLFRSGLPDNAWSGFGALAGSWIGGTGNLAAVAESVGTPSELVGIVVIVDNLVYLAYFPLILVSKRWAKSFNRWTGVSQADLDHFADATKQVERKTHEVHFRDVLTLLGWAFVAILVANSLSMLVPPLPPVLTQKTWALLLVTTFGILLSATSLRNVPGTEPLAMAFVYIYMTMIGASADLRALGGAQWFIVAGFVTIAIHLLFVLAGAKLLRLDVGMAVTASVAAVGGADGPSRGVTLLPECPGLRNP
jgi:uncharacterized membrane protein